MRFYSMLINKSKSEKTRVILIMLMLCASALAFAAPVQAPIRVAFLRLSSEGVSSQLERTINEVLLSFTLEMKGYVVEDLNTTPEQQVMFSNFSYIFTGKMSAIDEEVRLELVFKDKTLKVVRQISKSYENSNRILLDSRLLVKNLFDAQDSNIIPNIAESQIDEEQQNLNGVKQLALDKFEAISTVDSLAGAWYVEDGEVEKIMIMRGGRGVAIWVSGISLLLDLKLENGVLVITQKGVPQPRQFVDLPDNIAVLAAKTVKPIVWKFNVNQGLNVLSGMKNTSSVKYKNNEIISVSEIAVPVQWHRN